MRSEPVKVTTPEEQDGGETRMRSSGVGIRVYNFDCPYGLWNIVHRDTGELIDFDCQSWSCPVHGPILAWRWRQRLLSVPWQFMLTLTRVPERRVDARVAWAVVARYLRKQGMRTFVRVMEFGSKTGMRHWHVLLEGEWHAKPPFDMAELRGVVAGAGFGPRVHVGTQRPEETRSKGVSYLLKYLVKDLGVRDTRTRGWRRITASRSVPSWDVVKALRNKNMGIDEEQPLLLRRR